MKRYLFLGALLLAFSTSVWGYEIDVSYSSMWMNTSQQSGLSLHTLPWPSPLPQPHPWPWVDLSLFGNLDPCGCSNPCGGEEPCPSPCSSPCPCQSPCPSPCQSPCMNIIWLWLSGDDWMPDCGCNCGCD